MLQPKDKDWQNRYKNNIPINAVYKKITLNLGTYTGTSSQLRKERQCQRMLKLLHNCTHLIRASGSYEERTGISGSFSIWHHPRACNVGDLGLIPGLGRSPGEGNGYPLQYYWVENPMDRGAW